MSPALLPALPSAPLLVPRLLVSITRASIYQDAPIADVIGRPEALWMAMGIAAVVAVAMSLTVGHGVLRPLLEARGIRPWTFKDSLGALMLVLIGSAAVGAGLAALVVCRLYHSDFALFDVLCLALLAVGALMMRLGLLALRKLT